MLRWIEQISVLIARILRRDPTLSLELARQYAEDAEAQVLGPLGDLVARLDAASAARLLNDPDRLFGYAQTLALRSAISRASGSSAHADVMAQRAVAIGREACRRADPVRPDWENWVDAAERDLGSPEQA